MICAIPRAEEPLFFNGSPWRSNWRHVDSAQQSAFKTSSLPIAAAISSRVGLAPVILTGMLARYRLPLYRASTIRRSPPTGSAPVAAEAQAIWVE